MLNKLRTRGGFWLRLVLGIALGLVAAMMIGSLAAGAQEFRGRTCEDVYAFVDQHGEVKAWVLAKAHGISRPEMKAARKCLRDRAQRARE